MVEFDLDGTTKRVQFLGEPGRRERYAAHSGIPRGTTMTRASVQDVA